MTVADKSSEIVHDRPNNFDHAESKRKVFDKLERQLSISTGVTSRAAQLYCALVTWHATASERPDLLGLEFGEIARDAMVAVRTMEWGSADRSLGEDL